MSDFLVNHASEFLCAGLALLLGFALGMGVAILGYSWHEKAGFIDVLEAMGLVERVEDIEEDAETR